MITICGHCKGKLEKPKTRMNKGATAICLKCVAKKGRERYHLNKLK